jgi:predicted DNA-binding transcriptional regulator YafY
MDCEPSERTVNPLGLVAKGSVWYLVATAEGEARTYRVSRISKVLILNVPSARPADFDLSAYWERSAAEFREQLPRYHATFLVKPTVMRWVRYRGWRLIERGRDSPRRFVVNSGAERFPPSKEVDAIGLSEMASMLAAPGA